MMAVNSLTPNMPRFDTLQKEAEQHSTYSMSVTAHHQVHSQLCSEHHSALASLVPSLLQAAILSWTKDKSTRTNQAGCYRLHMHCMFRKCILIHTSDMVVTSS